uniref:ORF92 n=1 Tax=Spilarctia obliqua nucleopolyhedrovirus TaxID=1638618 RepID=A0A7G9U8I0_9ABAC|nr:ORF92 [Spilarctia obliqua nucleopolyhedrovirus]
MKKRKCRAAPKIVCGHFFAPPQTKRRRRGCGNAKARQALEERYVRVNDLQWIPRRAAYEIIRDAMSSDSDRPVAASPPPTERRNKRRSKKTNAALVQIVIAATAAITTALVAAIVMTSL